MALRNSTNPWGGGGVTVLTDHKPLVSINQNSLSKAPKRLQNLHLCAQQYSYTLRYKPRKEIPRSDMLSQAPANKLRSSLEGGLIT